MSDAFQPHPAGRPDYTTLTFPPPSGDRPYVVANMVSAVDGKVTIEGTERGLGSKTDQLLMRELRVHADVVLNGAGTLRASGTSSRLDAEYLERLRAERGKTPRPVAAVISRSGDLPLDRAFFTSDAFEAVVFLSSAAPAARRAAIAETGRPVVDVPDGEELRAALQHMRRTLRCELLLVEGGPHLNGALLAADALDELFLTLGPVLVAGPDGMTAVENEVPPSIDGSTSLDLIHAIPNPETNEVYLRYRVRR